MLVNRETDYAIRIARNLKVDELNQIEPIAEKENISTTMAHKVARKLKQKGLIKSKSGINGGYYLSRPLEEITLFDVFGMMNEYPQINACLVSEDNCPFAKLGTCKVHNELYRIQQIVFEELQRKPLSELA